MKNKNEGNEHLVYFTIHGCYSTIDCSPKESAADVIALAKQDIRELHPQMSEIEVEVFNAPNSDKVLATVKADLQR